MTLIAQLFGGSQVATPKTHEELMRLVDRRDEITGQLRSLSDQRNQLAHQIESLEDSPSLREGPMARLKAIDADIGKLESDLRASNEAITAAKAKGLGLDEDGGGGVTTVNVQPAAPDPGWALFNTQQPWRERVLDSLAVTGPVTIATVVLLGVLMYWRISRSMKNQLAKLMALQAGRLEELQRSVDTVAVEVERVSENQRYVTKLVGDRPAPERR